MPTVPQIAAGALYATGVTVTTAGLGVALSNEPRRNTFGAGFREYYPPTSVFRGYEQQPDPTVGYAMGQMGGALAGTVGGLGLLGGSLIGDRVFTSLKGNPVMAGVSLLASGVGLGMSMFGVAGILGAWDTITRAA